MCRFFHSTETFQLQLGESWVLLATFLFREENIKLLYLESLMKFVEISGHLMTYRSLGYLTDKNGEVGMDSISRVRI
ncbi:unnamed protein product [Blepharisma stoltei]|uniref:Uncharacterized protein n=1 Tax=Blepharisma stoltei TaxID=1481888 RepID=A0AAU9JJ78_9CILI|nr:unnamed protein product [Blepharisma stoltei]